jgi:hypothetical protein
MKVAYIRLGKVPKLVLDWNSSPFLGASFLCVEFIKDRSEIEGLDAQCAPFLFPDAIVCCETGSCTGSKGVGWDGRDGEVGEEEEVEVDGETADCGDEDG